METPTNPHLVTIFRHNLPDDSLSSEPQFQTSRKSHSEETGMLSHKNLPLNGAPWLSIHSSNHRYPEVRLLIHFIDAWAILKASCPIGPSLT
jgi:hypothetical protein